MPGFSLPAPCQVLVQPLVDVHEQLSLITALELLGAFNECFYNWLMTLAKPHNLNLRHHELLHQVIQVQENSSNLLLCAGSLLCRDLQII